MNKNRVSLLALVLVFVLIAGLFTGCKNAITSTVTATPEATVTSEPIMTPVPTPTATQTPAPTEKPEVPLVVAYPAFSGKFSPFCSDIGYDEDVVKMTQISLMTLDRMGGVVYNAIEGETIPYKGVDYTYTGPADLSVSYDEESNTTAYTARIRDDLYFSDGEHVTADDIIFTYYVYLDTSYVGACSLDAYNIIGAKNYRTQTTDEVYARYEEMAKAIYAAGKDHTWADTDAWTQEQQDYYWNSLKLAWIDDAQAIVDYCLAKYLDEASAKMFGRELAEIKANTGLQVAFSMWLWGIGEFGEDGAFAGNMTGTKWDLKEVFPTIEDYYIEFDTMYDGDPEAYWVVENADDTDVLSVALDQFIGYWGPLDPEVSGGIDNITGIRKVDEYTVEVTTEGYHALAVYGILGIMVTPLHYYGDELSYDYENNQFGFPRGDLSGVMAKQAIPMGAGAYKFIKYENKTVYFEANENYYKGAPKTQYIQFKETDSSEVAAGVAAGTVDAGELPGSRDRFEEIRGYNHNKELSGDIVTTNRVDSIEYYSYIGQNAANVCVAGEPGSDASKNLRKALATVMAVYRDTSINSYYGDAASVINYPISNTSWAAPQPTDDDYRLAFSVDIDGNSIYSADMAADEKYAAALRAAIGYFEAAGYTFTDGMVTGTPEGTRPNGSTYTDFTVYVPGSGTGEHPCYALLVDAQTALAGIGITLTIHDPIDPNVMWKAINAGTQDLWCAASLSAVDPDMYQRYFSTNAAGLGGTDSNYYHIADAQLDQLILDARKSDDQSYRKAAYRQSLDIIMDWAVEIPAYQRQNCVVFSAERINADTITPDITSYWGWMNGIELLEMN